MQHKPLDLKSLIFLNDWTPEKLVREREALGLSQADIGKILGVSQVTILNIEKGRKTDPFAIQMYGLVLERYYAYTRGYIPAYRKVGENKYKEGNLLNG